VIQHLLQFAAMPEFQGGSLETYYFDLKDGVPVRDRHGLDFPTASHAIEHARNLARRISQEGPPKDPALAIIVLNEAGSEIHRERVYRQPD